MVETKPAGFGASTPVPSGLRPADAHFVMRLARYARIALRRLPRGSPRRTANRIESIWPYHALAPVTEFTLANGRRVDVAALNAKAEIIGVEIKVSLADLRSDRKWTEYLDYCDYFYFAVPPEFPQRQVPEQGGLIVADCYGGAIVRPARRHASLRAMRGGSFGADT